MKAGRGASCQPANQPVSQSVRFDQWPTGSPHNAVLAEWLKLSSWPMSRSTPVYQPYFSANVVHGRGCTHVSTVGTVGVKRVISMAKYALNIAFIINADRFRAWAGTQSFDRGPIRVVIVVIDILRWICIKLIGEKDGKYRGKRSRRERHASISRMEYIKNPSFVRKYHFFFFFSFLFQRNIFVKKEIRK